MPKRSRKPGVARRYSISKPCEHTAEDRKRLQYGETFACEYRGPHTAAVAAVVIVIGCVPVESEIPF